LPKKPWRKRRKSSLIHRVGIRAKERISILTDPEGNARESSMLLPHLLGGVAKMEKQCYNGR
jgi:hypothetical protein